MEKLIIMPQGQMFKNSKEAAEWLYYYSDENNKYYFNKYKKEIEKDFNVTLHWTTSKAVSVRNIQRSLRKSFNNNYSNYLGFDWIKE